MTNSKPVRFVIRTAAGQYVKDLNGAVRVFDTRDEALEAARYIKTVTRVEPEATAAKTWSPFKTWWVRNFGLGFLFGPK